MKKKIGEFMLENFPFFFIPTVLFWVYLAVMATSVLGILGYMTCLGFSIMVLINIMKLA